MARFPEKRFRQSYEGSLLKVKADVLVCPSGDEMQADSKTVERAGVQ
jgi:hypothetical protein